MDVIVRVCQRKHVNPIWMFANLLDILRLNHQMFGLPVQGKPPSTVFDEITGTLRLMERQDDPPPSVLAWLDLQLQLHQSAAADDARDADPQEKIDPAVAEYLRQKALAEEALRLIVREVINASETEGLEQAMMLDQSLRQANEAERQKRERPDDNPSDENLPDDPPKNPT
ncbi:MAG: hypothetical protein QOF78_4454 [Phycisphaerales bacterium]|jgi:hypothetical protein|nr:hypothetical protein [Phycisphaerales bacterium]